VRKWYLKNWVVFGLSAVCLCLFFLTAGGPIWGDGQQKTGKFYVIGMGPAGPDLATLRALETLKEVDIVLCSEDMPKRFESYLKGKEILCDPWKGMFFLHGKFCGELNETETKEWQKERVRIREEIVKKIKEEMARGKTVAILENGDPCTFGPSHWFVEQFDDHQVEIIPGLGCYNAAIAALKKSMIPAYDNRCVMLTSPHFLLGPRGEDEQILKEISKYTTTMVFYMGTRKMDRLVDLLKKYYPSDLPIAVVYYAGYGGKEEVVKGTLATILDRIQGKEQTWLGLIIVGRCLEGMPYIGSMENIVWGGMKWW
jgi:precorrin-4 methylase